jgi:hypothetical protein
MNKQGATLAAYGGHLADLWRLWRMRSVTNPYSYTKFRIINMLRKLTGAKVMVETGTYLGNTADRCARKFDKVYTVELDQDLARRATEFLKRRPNVRVIQGDGLVELPKVLELPEVDNVLIFLDGHYSGGITAKGDLPEPAADELKAIAPFKHKVRAVIIDDFRSFGKEPGFPRKSDLFRSIEENMGGGYTATVHLDQVIVARTEYGALPT